MCNHYDYEIERKRLESGRLDISEAATPDGSYVMCLYMT